MPTVEGHRGAQAEALMKPYFMGTVGAAHHLYLNIYESTRKKKTLPGGACLCDLLNLQRTCFWSILMLKRKKGHFKIN